MPATKKTRDVKITTNGIKSVIRKLKFSTSNFPKSIAEYIWNGFDANATQVELDIVFSQSILKNISIKDNGTGISHEELASKFGPFFESEKVIFNSKLDKHISDVHGKVGIGRLTFFTFAHFAKWETVYSEFGKNHKYNIEIAANTLKDYVGIDNVPLVSNEETGTLVSFSGFLKEMHNPELFEEVVDYLKLEFCWYLELYPNKKLLINGTELAYKDIIGEDSEEIEIKCGKPEKRFHVKYIRWKEHLNEEYSKFYYLNDKKKEKYKENTTLNNQGDQFYHSVFVSSEYFEKFNFESEANSGQQALTGEVRSSENFKLLQEELYTFLRRKRKPFLKEHSKEFIDELKKEKVLFEEKENNPFDTIKSQSLELTIRGIYEIEPKIFNKLNGEQKTALIGMLRLVLESEDREKIMSIMEQIIKLDPEERTELDNLLKVTKLSSIIKTMNLIKHRYEVLESLKKINFDNDFGANEVDHLQGVIETNTWVFGEQYSLIAAAEDDFDKALKVHRATLEKEESTEPIASEDSKKQVDIFMCRQNKQNGKVHNIIIELKHPQKKLGEKAISQIKKYFRVILGESRFNASGYTWEYILVGSGFDSTGYVESELKNLEKLGESGLIYHVDNQKIYVKKWSDVLMDCDLRHQFLNEHLDIQKSKLAAEIKTPEDAIKKAKPDKAKVFLQK